MPKLLHRLKYFLSRGRRHDDLAEEIELHRAMTQEQFERAGMTPREAWYASRRAMGSVTRAVEDAREVWLWPSLERLWQDIRHGARMLRQQPAFATAAVLTLALGIGATTTVVSVVEAELWRPLPFPDAGRLVALYTTGPGTRSAHDGMSGPDFADWRARALTFDGLTAFGETQRRVLRSRKVPEVVRMRPVTSEFFTTLGRGPMLGRGFARHDESGRRSIVLNGECWQRLFDSDPDVIGRAIRLDDDQYTIVGVLAPESRLEIISDPDMFVATDFASAAAPGDRQRRNLYAIGRLKPGVAIDTADAEVKTIAADLAREHPTTHAQRSARAKSLGATYTSNNWRPLYLFLGAALFLFLLACANIANLLLGRALRRQREFAIRAALGGGRAALVRQLLVEGLLLAVPGTIAGLFLSWWTIDLVSAWIPPTYLSRGGQFAIDLRVLGFAATLGALTTVAFGFAPALFTRIDVNAALAPGTRAIAGSIGQRRIRHAFVIAEIATAFVLVFAAGLFVNSFINLTQMSLGFDPRDRVALNLPLSGRQFNDPRRIVELSDELTTRMRAVPGVLTAAIGTTVPLESGPSARFVVADRPLPPPGEDGVASIRSVTPEYISALGIRRLAGRELTHADHEGNPRVAIINETLARRFFPGENPLGREIVFGAESWATWLKPGRAQIVGVVANSKNVGLNEVDFNQVYVPFAQHPASSIRLVVQTSVPPASVIDSLRQAVLETDPTVPVLSVMTMAQRVEQAFRADRFHLLLIGGFALVAVLLAAAGVYGAMAYAMQQRTPEFALRLALGARGSSIVALALSQAMRLGVAGTALGLGVSLMLARLLGNALYLVEREHEGLLYGVTTTDPSTLAWACAALTALAAIAGLVPAARAMRVDPVVALRAD